MEGLLLGVGLIGIHHHRQVAGVLGEQHRHGGPLLHQTGLVVHDVAAGHADRLCRIFAAVLRYLHAVDQTGGAVGKVEHIGANTGDVVHPPGGHGGVSVFFVGLTFHIQLVVSGSAAQPLVGDECLILVRGADVHVLAALGLHHVECAGHVIIDVPRLAVGHLVALVVLLIVVPQPAAVQDKLSHGLILPVVLPVPALGHTGHGAVLLQYIQQGVGFPQVRDLRVILPRPVYFF